MKTRHIATLLAVAMSPVAFGQAGVEGQYDLLFWPNGPDGAAAPAVRPQAAAPAAPVRVAAALPAPKPELPALNPVREIVPPIAAPAVTAPAVVPNATAAPTPLGTPRTGHGRGSVADYDFGEVLVTLRNSVNPLHGELAGNFQQFVAQLDQAIDLMKHGHAREAIALSSQAVEGVLQSRDAVVNPLWEAQFFLNAQIAAARARLAGSLEREDPTSAAGKAETQATRMLDTIAQRIAATKDPVRKRQLIAHYRTIRTLEKVRKSSLAMSPDQRKLWFGVVRTLEQAATAHQQVLLGCETMYAQLDSTATQLRDYQGLMRTLDGVDALVGSVDHGGMAGFVDGMQSLQDQMEKFSQSLDGALQSSMADLETRVDELQASEPKGDGKDGSVMTPTSIDDELQGRMDRLSGSRK